MFNEKLISLDPEEGRHRPLSSLALWKRSAEYFVFNLLLCGSAPMSMVNQTLKKRIMALQSELEKETLGVPVKLYRIGELVNCTPFSRQTIHNYTIMGLIREATWTDGGHRLYDESVFERLSEILRLRKTKTLSQIREILSRKERLDSQSVKMTGRAEPKKP